MKRYRVAIIGTGASVGSHFEAIAALGDRLELVAAVDRNEERVRAVCAQYRVRTGTPTRRRCSPPNSRILFIL
jgi:predicted dehydrogenase